VEHAHGTNHFISFHVTLEKVIY